MQPSQDRRPSERRALPRRRTDRIEDLVAWLLTTAGLFVFLLGVATGVSVRSALLEHDRAAARDRTQVEAVLGVEPPQVHANGATSLSARTARFTDPAGQEHEVIVTVDAGLPAGSAVPVWVDREGRLTGPPLGAVDALVLGASAAVGIVGVGVSLLFGAWRAVRWELGRRNTAAWADEWSRVEPEWSRQGR